MYRNRWLKVLSLGLLLAAMALSLSAPSPTQAQGCPGNYWSGNFYNSTNLSGVVAATSCNEVINFNWGAGSPLFGVHFDNFSARWSSSQVLPNTGNYRFTAVVQDGMRLYINGVPFIDAFDAVPGPRTLTAVYFNPNPNSSVNLTLEYVNYVGNAQLSLSWFLEGSGAVPGDNNQPWIVTYYNNVTWSDPVVASETQSPNGINRNYETNAPLPGVNADNWSSFWRRTVFLPAGTYRLYLRADDGAKVRINGTEVLNQSEFIQGRTISTDVALPAGAHAFQIEHFDVGDRAYLFFTWTPAIGTTLSPDGGIVGVSPPPVTQPSPGETLTATVNVGGLFFRREPATGAGVLSILRRGEQYTAVARTIDAQWVQLNVNGVLGWSSAGFLLLNGDINRLSVSGVAGQVPDIGVTGVQVSSRAYMRIRSGPGTNFERIDGIPPRTVLNVLAITRDGQWIQVEFNGRSGWTARDYYDVVRGNLGNVPVVEG